MHHDPLADLLALRTKPERLIIGLMSGTSADGVDATLVRIGGHGPGCTAQLVAFESLALPEPLKQRIWRLPDDRSPDLCELNFRLGEVFAEAAMQVVATAGLQMTEIDLVGSHGQTARHNPPTGGASGSTLQIGEGAVIAERTGLPVICDFRVADVAAGGHGAPLIPLVDQLLFSSPDRTTALLNIGGIANVTVVPPPPAPLIAFDTGPGNITLDAVARAASGGLECFDRDGERARRGRPDSTLLARLLAHPFFDQPPPRSTGRETFGRDFIYPLLDGLGSDPSSLDDLMATLTCLTAQSVALAFDRFILPSHQVDQIYVSGGGVHNSTLIELLTRLLDPIQVESLGKAGVNPDAKEAIGFAVLANETLFCSPGNVPSATGARGPRILGKLVLPTTVLPTVLPTTVLPTTVRFCDHSDHG